MPKLATRLVRLLSVPPLVVAAAAGIAPGPAVAARTGVFAVSGVLKGVAATSAGNAWAVGYAGSAKAVILRWNGRTWKQLRSPASGQLTSVAATSASNAWAVGCTSCYTSRPKSLILRWHSRAWKQLRSPASGQLTSVAATSASNAWAVGSSGRGALILRWNGSAWKRVLSPAPSGSSLSGVAATSAGNAWAVGEVVKGFSFTSLILHWNGSAWKRVPSPLPKYGRYGNALAGVVAISAASAWAVGCTDGCPVGGTPVIERWQGTSWKQVAPPATPYAIYSLTAVAAISAAQAWAVGGGGPVTSEAAATAHWNGHRWTLSPGRSGAELTGVAAISAGDAWAVGGTATGHTLILHWNGKTWK